MKESIGGTQLFLIVVVLVILFTGIMAMAINRANSFAVKDKIINILEKHDGLDPTAELYSGSRNVVLEEIVDTLSEMSYRQSGTCPDSTPGAQVLAYQRNGQRTVGNRKSSFCIVKINGRNVDGTLPVFYYQVIVFYRLNLPVFQELFNFRTMGETKPLHG